MKPLTFKGFISKYTLDLSQNHTLNIRKLAKESVSVNPRIQPLLVLNAAAFHKTDLLRKYLINEPHGKEMLMLLDQLQDTDVETAFSENILPETYQKVWNSFLYRKNREIQDKNLKESMRRKIFQLQKEKNTDLKTVCKSLSLPYGRISRWLATGNHSLVNYDSLRKVIDYFLNH